MENWEESFDEKFEDPEGTVGLAYFPKEKVKAFFKEIIQEAKTTHNDNCQRRVFYQNGVEAERKRISEIVEDIISIAGIPNIPVKFSTPRSADIPRSYGSNAKAICELAWGPRVEWSEALRRTIGWYQNR